MHQWDHGSVGECRPSVAQQAPQALGENHKCFHTPLSLLLWPSFQNDQVTVALMPTTATMLMMHKGKCGLSTPWTSFGGGEQEVEQQAKTIKPNGQQHWAMGAQAAAFGRQQSKAGNMLMAACHSIKM